MIQVSADGLEIGLIHYDRDGAHDQIKREHYAALILVAADDAFQPSHRPTSDANSASYAQVRMGFDSAGTGLPVSQTLDFLLWQVAGWPLKLTSLTAPGTCNTCSLSCSAMRTKT